MMEKSEVAVSGPFRAIDSVPLECVIAVTEVRSSGMVGKPGVPGRRAACATSIFTVLFG
jgi:hypothetical protein